MGHADSAKSKRANEAYKDRDRIALGSGFLTAKSMPEPLEETGLRILLRRLTYALLTGRRLDVPGRMVLQERHTHLAVRNLRSIQGRERRAAGVTGKVIVSESNTHLCTSRCVAFLHPASNCMFGAIGVGCLINQYK